MPGARVKVRIESKAIQALAARLASLDRKVARKALKDGVNEATKLVLWDAKALVPTRTGLLRKSIGRKIVTRKGGALIFGFIGPRRGFKMIINGQPVNPVKYAHLVEFGRREVRVKKKKVLVGSGVPVSGKMATQAGPWQPVFFGKKVRSVAPRAFMRPAWERNKRRVVGVIIEALHRAFQEFFRKGRARRAA